MMRSLFFRVRVMESFCFVVLFLFITVKFSINVSYAAFISLHKENCMNLFLNDNNGLLKFVVIMSVYDFIVLLLPFIDFNMESLLMMNTMKLIFLILEGLYLFFCVLWFNWFFKFE